MAPENISAFVFGLLGNIISAFVFLAPVPTFYTICKRRSSEGFHAIPYSVALFSATLLLYYAYIKQNALMLITINSFGCVIESTYLIIFMIYATRTLRISTAKLLILFNVGALGSIVALTLKFSKGSLRTTIVGWICAVFSVCVFAAPLSIMREVIRTKSVQYMPFSLSCCLTVCAVMWLLYGISIKDYFIATPNVLGLAFGAAQIILYNIYKDRRNNEILPENNETSLETHAISVEMVVAETLEIVADIQRLPENGMNDHEISDNDKENEPSVTVIEVSA